MKKTTISKADRMEMSVLRLRGEVTPASTLCTATLESSEVCLPRIIHNIIILFIRIIGIKG